MNDEKKTEKEKKMEETWIESHEALLDLNEERLSGFEAVDHEPEVHLPIEHVMRYDSHGSNGPGVYCTCGAKRIHGRGKVLVAWSRRHTKKTGHKWKGQS